MPAMLRPSKKAQKIAEAILGRPKNQTPVSRKIKVENISNDSRYNVGSL